MLYTTRNVLARCHARVATPLFRREQARFSRCLLSTLAILEQRDGQLVNGTLSAFTAAKKLGGPVHGFVAGASVGDAAKQAAKVDGVEKVITVENKVYEKVSWKDVLGHNIYAFLKLTKIRDCLRTTAHC